VFANAKSGGACSDTTHECERYDGLTRLAIRLWRCRNVVKSTRIRACSDASTGDLYSQFANDAWSKWNLGEGGMQVDVSGVKPKEAVQLSFRLPVSGLAVDAVGIVIWGAENRHGIQFTHVGTQSQQSIHQYVMEHK
jgi:hypothetical protein